MKKKARKAKDMTNSELKLKMNEMEQLYESIKQNVVDEIERMHELDIAYDELREELRKRTSNI